MKSRWIEQLSKQNFVESFRRNHRFLDRMCYVTVLLQFFFFCRNFSIIWEKGMMYNNNKNARRRNEKYSFISKCSSGRKCWRRSSRSKKKKKKKILEWKVHSSKKNKPKERGYHRSRFEKCSRSKPSRIPEDFAQGLNEPQCREEKDGVIYSTLVVSQPLVLQTRMFLVIRILPRLFNASTLSIPPSSTRSFASKLRPA